VTLTTSTTGILHHLKSNIYYSHSQNLKSLRFSHYRDILWRKFLKMGHESNNAHFGVAHHSNAMHDPIVLPRPTVQKIGGL